MQKTISQHCLQHLEEQERYGTEEQKEFYRSVIAKANEIRPESDGNVFRENLTTYLENFISMQWGNESVGNTVFGLFSIVGDSIAGIALYGFKVLFIIVPGAIIQMIESLLGSVGNNTIEWINLDTIFFNQLPLFDINVFSMTTAEGVQLQSGNVLYDIRNNVSKWYYAIRNLCIALSLAVLVYIAVRMAISNLAEDRAKYKKMLKDWLVGFALIFVLHYLMIFIVNLNNGIVSVLDTARHRQASTTTASVAIFNTTTSSLQTSILVQAFDVTLSRGMTAAILYVMLVGMTMLFIVVYIKRFITICFLTMIAPLITVTYSIDKVGDGRAQALGKWLKEIVFTVNSLIQFKLYTVMREIPGFTRQSFLVEPHSSIPIGAIVNVEVHSFSRHGVNKNKDIFESIAVLRIPTRICICCITIGIFFNNGEVFGNILPVYCINLLYCYPVR